MQVSNIKTDVISVADNLTKNKEFADIPTELMPTSKNYMISFELHNCNTATANAIRICTLEEIEWKALEVDLSQIKTTEPDVILNELRDRISFIPINQDVPDDVKFSLHIANKEMHDIVAYTGAITRTGGAGSAGSTSSKESVFDERFRLVLLSPGKTLDINDIKVVKGHGFQHAKFTTCNFEYNILDYTDVYYLSNKEQILSHMTSNASIHEEMKRMKLRGSLVNARILAIPDTNILGICSERTKQKISTYDIILENSKLSPTPSSVANPESFYLSFTFFCKVDVKEVMARVMQTLINRLTFIQEHLLTPSTNIEITLTDNFASILIRGEDDVIGNLIAKNVMILDPSVGMINYMKIHPSNRSVIIKVIHSQPLKIVSDAITKVIADLTDIQKAFT